MMEIVPKPPSFGTIEKFAYFCTKYNHVQMKTLDPETQDKQDALQKAVDDHLGRRRSKGVIFAGRPYHQKHVPQAAESLHLSAEDACLRMRQKAAWQSVGWRCGKAWQE